MTTKTMSIHRALSELKMLDTRIQNATSKVQITVEHRESYDTIDNTPVEEFKAQMQASFDRAAALIRYRDRLKRAIVKSNAETIVTVGDKEMTVAEAIEQKTSIEYKRSLLSKLTVQYRSNLALVNRNNESLPDRLETYLVNILGSKDKHKPEEVEMHTKAFMERNRYVLIDPLNAKKIIEELEEEIQMFESEVDAILSESNAITQITVDVD